MSNTILYLITLFIISLFGTWWIFKKILRIAVLKDITDNPNVRKLQKRPIPVLGGVAVFFGMTVSLLATGLMYDTSRLFTVLGAMTIMLYVGTMDDILSLSPALRFMIEILVVLVLAFSNNMLLDNFHGLWGIEAIPFWLALPLTVITGVGIINSINLIDGVNGLSSGYCIMASSVFCLAFIHFGDIDSASLAILSIGALLPFFCHNVFGLKSKMFMGDGGTLLMGIIMTTFVISAIDGNSPMSINASENFSTVAFALAVLSIPVFDTLRVMILRLARGTSPFLPDKTHLHHLLFNLGFSHIGTTMTEIMSNAIIIGIWYLCYRAGASVNMQLYIVVILAILATFGFYWWAKVQMERRTKAYIWLRKLGELTHVGHKRWYEHFRNRLDTGCDYPIEEQRSSESQL